MVIVSANISKSNLTSQSFANLYNLLNNKTNVPDPIFTNSTRKFVYAREPDVQNINSDGYPFIIIRPARITTRDYTFDAGSSWFDFEFEIEIRCTDRVRGKEGSGNYAIGIQYVDEITDGIIKTLNDKTNRLVLNAYGMGTFLIETEDVDVDDFEGDVVWVRRIMLKSKSRLKGGI